LVLLLLALLPALLLTLLLSVDGAVYGIIAYIEQQDA